jgi:hypothetical protein
MIKLVIADSGPLISLSMADALDFLLEFKPGVQVEIFSRASRLRWFSRSV